MITDIIVNPKKKYKRLKTIDKDIDWELVEDFKEGLEELKQGKVIKC
jgi:hypothetical protein